MTGKYLLLALLATAAFAQDPVSITPYQLIDARAGNAIACSNCSIYTYAAGTNTPLATYTSSTLATPNTNPVLTNSAGYAVNGATVTGIWVGSSCYKFVAKDSSAVTLFTQDNICDRGAVLKALLAASSGSSLVGFIQAGGGAVARTAQAKMRETFSVTDFGATGNGSTDDTAAIQAALTAGAGGQMVYCPPGVYKISATLYLPSFVTFYGPPNDFLNSYGGCTLTWYGSAPATPYVHGSAMLEAYKVNGTNVSGINFEGQVTTNLTGYMDDAQGGGVAQRNSIKNSAFFRFGNPATDAPGAAMVYGTEGYSGITEQVDGVENIDNTGTNVYVFIRINNLNFAYSRFQRSSAVYFNKGMDIRASGWARVESPAYGLTMGTNPCVFCFSGTHGQWNFNQVQSEQDASITLNPKMFLIDQSAGQPGDPSPIIITNSIFGYPSTISAPNANIISKGNHGGPTVAITITAAANATLVTKEADYPDTVWTIQNGTSAVKNLGVPIARGSIQEFDMSLDDSNATPLVKYQVNPVATTMTEPFNQYRNLVGGVDTARWTNFWSTTYFGIKDLTTSYNSLSLASGMNTGDGIQCVIGSCVVAGATLDAVGGTPMLTRYFSTQGGINGAITVTSPDGTYAPSLANPAFCVYLDNNTLIGGAGNTISFNGAAPVAIFNKQNSAQITTTYAVGTTFCGMVGGSGLIHER